MPQYNIQMAINDSVCNLNIKASRAMIERELLECLGDAGERGDTIQANYSMPYAIQAVRKLLENKETGAGSFSKGDWTKGFKR